MNDCLYWQLAYQLQILGELVLRKVTSVSATTDNFQAVHPKCVLFSEIRSYLQVLKGNQGQQKQALLGWESHSLTKRDFPWKVKGVLVFVVFFLLTVDVYVSDSCGDYYHIKLCSSFKWECLYRHIDISMLANTLLIALTIFSLINSFIIQPLFSCLFLFQFFL